MTIRWLIAAFCALLPAAANAAESPLDMGPQLTELASAMQSDARAIIALTGHSASEGALVRRHARADGVQFFTILPPFKGQATVAGVAAVDRFAQSVFAYLNAQVPAHSSPQSGFQGFRAVQYTDGETGITYAVLLPQVRPKAAQPDADKVQFCQSLAAPRSPRADPPHPQDRYIERGAAPDSHGAWYAYAFRYLAHTCTSAACATYNPSGNIWSLAQSCRVVHPQPVSTQLKPAAPLAAAGDAGADPWEIDPVWTPWNTGYAWTFACRYGGVAVDCYTGWRTQAMDAGPPVAPGAITEGDALPHL